MGQIISSWCKFINKNNKRVRKEAKAAGKKEAKAKGLSGKERREAVRSARGEVFVKNKRSYGTAAAGAAAGVLAAMAARKVAGEMFMRSAIKAAGKTLMNASGMANNIISGENFVKNMALDSIKLSGATVAAGALAIGSSVAATTNVVRKAGEARDIYTYNKNKHN